MHWMDRMDKAELSIPIGNVTPTNEPLTLSSRPERSEVEGSAVFLRSLSRLISNTTSISLISKSQTQRRFQAAHRVRGQRKTELRAVHRCVPAGKHGVIQHIRRRD